MPYAIFYVSQVVGYLIFTVLKIVNFAEPYAGSTSRNSVGCVTLKSVHSLNYNLLHSPPTNLA